MTDQLDIFAPREEDVVPVSHWGKGRLGGLGPHETREEFCKWIHEERVLFAEEKPHYRAGAFIGWDSSTDLWIYGMDIMGRDFGEFMRPTYHNGGFRSREACVEAARIAALEKWGRHKRTPARSYEDEE